MDLTRLRRRATNRLQTGPHLPGWWPAVQIVAGVSLLVFLLWSLGTGSSSTVPTEVHPVAPPVTAATPTPAPTATPPPTADTVTVAGPDGEPVDVPAGAVEAGRAWAAALFTGRFDDVPLADGTSPPAVSTVWADPDVRDPVLQDDDGMLRLAFPVDPDRDGPAGLRNVVVRVTTDGSSWVVVG